VHDRRCDSPRRLAYATCSRRAGTPTFFCSDPSSCLLTEASLSTNRWLENPGAGHKPGPKPKKIADGRGLFLLLTPAGQRWWRFKYRFAGKEKLLSLGSIRTSR
jgi:hypothetical protein